MDIQIAACASPQNLSVSRAVKVDSRVLGIESLRLLDGLKVTGAIYFFQPL